ncbi:MAG TPA: hypothetical protein VHB72_01760 [Candidatus Saccharimonadales bacterium]|nr:hypothetical protein [Candidatus Saccharimonadales bacterium]
MDKNGLRELHQVLSESDIEVAVIYPIPVENENVRFVTIETGPTHRPCDVLNALQAGGLMEYKGPRDAVISYRPEFHPIGVQQGSLTLEDTNHPSSANPGFGPSDL